MSRSDRIRRERERERCVQSGRYNPHPSMPMNQQQDWEAPSHPIAPCPRVHRSVAPPPGLSMEDMCLGSLLGFGQSAETPGQPLPGDWECIECTADSGACHWVGPPDMASHVEMEETPESRDGRYWTTASGQKVPAMGAKVIPIVTDDWAQGSVQVHIAKVKKMLGAVSKMCESGNRVDFDDDGSYILNKKTGHSTPMDKKNGVYVFKLWTWNKDKQKQKQDFQRQGK